MLHVGLIGYGYAGQTFHAPLIRATPGLALVAVASSDATKVHAKLGHAMAVVTPQELIARDDIDLVVIAVPNDLHCPLALSAMKAGRHVVVDKPFALDVAQAASLAAAAARSDRVLSVFHNRRWDGDFLTLQAVLRDRRVGRPVEFVSHFDRYQPQVRARWREGRQPGSGLWMDLGPHLVDQALQLFGTPSAIALDLASMRDGALTDDWFAAQLHWAHGPYAGLRARLQASMLAARPGARFTLHGTEASFSVDGLDPQEDVLKTVIDPALIADPAWGRDERQATLWRSDGNTATCTLLPLAHGAYPAYYAALRDALLGAGPCPVTAIDALAVQSVLDAGQRSARERREITLD